ncbi:MAG: AAA family ATPase [Eubacterium sp.]|nr:AAA family ATPase [Eubacterium sp.]
MTKKNVVIVESDENYISSLEFLLATREEKGISLELITSVDYLKEYLAVSRRIDCLIIDENLLFDAVSRQQIGFLFVLSEHGNRNDRNAAAGNVEYVDKYASVKEIFHRIIGKLGLPADDRVKSTENVKKETTTIVVNSQLGGIGKTTVSFALAIQLSKLNRSVLYMSTDFLQRNHHLVGIHDSMGGDFDRSIKARDGIFLNYLDQMVTHFTFDYLMPWNGSRASIDLDENDYLYMIEEIRRTKRYDFIIIDTETGLDLFTLTLMSKCDHILEIIDQTRFAKMANLELKKELRTSERDKVTYICNKFNHRKDNYISEEVVEYVEERTIDRNNLLRALEVADLLKVTAMTLV